MKAAYLLLISAALTAYLACAAEEPPSRTITPPAKSKPMNTFSLKEEKIVLISAYTARGDMPNLKLALAAGLDAGLTVNEIKEVLTQLYAYCGFPRSLNALGTFMAIMKERGGKDTIGNLPGPRHAGTSLEFGTANQTKLVGAPVKGPLFEFAPAIDEYLKAHLFGDIFARDNLDWKTRELATIAALAAMDGVEAQLKSHIAIGKHNGLTEAQIKAILALVHPVPVKTSPFPVGEENTGYAKYFSGKSYLAPLTKDKRLNAPAFNVTFEPGCRNNWHKHSGGQLLIAVGGIGYYQERGKPARRFVPGDVGRSPAGRGALARGGTRQLVLAHRRRVQSGHNQEHMARTGFRCRLPNRDRSLVTVSALIASGHVAQIPYHLNRVMDNGLTQPEAAEVLTHLAFYAGWPNAFSSLPVVKEVFKKRVK